MPPPRPEVRRRVPLGAWGGILLGLLSVAQFFSQPRPWGLTANGAVASELARLSHALSPSLAGAGTPAVVVFASGNAAMNSFMRNWGAWAERTGVGRHGGEGGGDGASDTAVATTLLVPLDAEGYADLLRDDRWKLARDEVAWGEFGAARSAFRGAAYARMAQHKLVVLATLLRLGRAALLSDPDVVLLRDPLPYLSRLAPCDVYCSVDRAELLSLEDIRVQGGYALGADAVYFNTGLMFVRPTAAAGAFIEALLQHVRDACSGGCHAGEQSFFNEALGGEYRLAVPPGGNAGDTIADAATAGACLEYVREARWGGAPAQVLRVMPLNQSLFPNHPVYMELRRRAAAAAAAAGDSGGAALDGDESPFTVHYNWLETSAMKRAAMIEGGHWLLDVAAPVPDE